MSRPAYYMSRKGGGKGGGKNTNVHSKDGLVICPLRKIFDNASGSVGGPEMMWNQDYFQIVTIDPGVENYGFRIERRYKFVNRISTLVFQKMKLVKAETGTNVSMIFRSLVDFLDQFMELFLGTHYIIIERQLHENTPIKEVEDATVMYFTLRLENSPLNPRLYLMDAAIKYKYTHPNGNKHGMNKAALKKWSGQRAKELFLIRGDDTAAGIIDANAKKADEFGDTTLMAEAFAIIEGLPITNTDKNENITHPGFFRSGEVNEMVSFLDLNQSASLLQGIGIPTTTQVISSKNIQIPPDLLPPPQLPPGQFCIPQL